MKPLKKKLSATLNAIAMLSAVLMMSSCASGITQTKTVIERKPVPIGEGLLRSCGEPDVLNDKTMGAILDNHVAVAKWGWKCKEQLDAVIKILRDYNEKSPDE